MENKLSKWGKFLHNSLSQVNKPYLMIGAIALLLIFNGSHLVESYKILTGAKSFKDYWHVGLAAACLEASVFFATYKNSKEYVLIGFFTAILCNLFSVFHSFEQNNALSGWEYYLPYFVGFVISSAFAYMPVFFSEHLATSIREEIASNEKKIGENSKLNELISENEKLSIANKNLSAELATSTQKAEKLSSKESELSSKVKELAELQAKLSSKKGELSSEKEKSEKLIKENEFLKNNSEELSNYENLKAEKLRIESELKEIQGKASEWKGKFLKLNESVSNFEQLKQKAQELETKLSVLQAKELEFNSMEMQDFESFVVTSTKIYNALQNYKNAKSKGTENLIQEKKAVLEGLRQVIFVKK